MTDDHEEAADGGQAVEPAPSPLAVRLEPLAETWPGRVRKLLAAVEAGLLNCYVRASALSPTVVRYGPIGLTWPRTPGRYVRLVRWAPVDLADLAKGPLEPPVLIVAAVTAEFPTIAERLAARSDKWPELASPPAEIELFLGGLKLELADLWLDPAEVEALDGADGADGASGTESACADRPNPVTKATEPPSPQAGALSLPPGATDRNRAIWEALCTVLRANPGAWHTSGDHAGTPVFYRLPGLILKEVTWSDLWPPDGKRSREWVERRLADLLKSTGTLGKHLRRPDALDALWSARFPGEPRPR